MQSYELLKCNTAMYHNDFIILSSSTQQMGLYVGKLEELTGDSNTKAHPRNIAAHSFKHKCVGWGDISHLQVTNVSYIFW